MPDNPSALRDGPHAEPGTSAIQAVSAPVHAAVPDVPPQDISPEILAIAMADLFQNDDVVWSTDRSAALETGKANFLRITSNGAILLDVIKPGVHFSISVELDVEVDLEAIKTYIREHDKWTCGSEGFLPAIVMDDLERVRLGLPFDSNGGSRPRAIYVFNRIGILQEPADGKPGLILQWIGRHTNPAEGKGNFQVEDTLQIKDL